MEGPPGARGRPILVAVDGGGGAGKSALVAALAGSGAAGAVAVVAVDDFHRPSWEVMAGRSIAAGVGEAIDWRRLAREVLEPLRGGHRPRYRRYDWTADAPGEWAEVESAGVVVVEGVYAARPELAGVYDRRVWVDCPRDVRLARVLARDGAGSREWWEAEWLPAEDRYVALAPWRWMDAVVDGRRDPSEGYRLLLAG
jgi:uridine kinase